MLAVIQARCSSTRLPNKIFKQILGKPMLARQLERIMRCKCIKRLLIATSDDPSDDRVQGFCEDLGIECFRGALDDVLDRFYQATRHRESRDIIRLTGDCPLCDPDLIDEVAQFYWQGEFDYASNTLEPTFPDGLDVEIFHFDCLRQAWQEAVLPSHREHVTPFIYTNPNRFRLGSFRGKTDLAALRWTVDEPKDIEVVEHIYQALYPIRFNFTTRDVLNYLEAHPELKTLNVEFKRNEGMLTSLRKDRKYLESGNQ